MRFDAKMVAYVYLCGGNGKITGKFFGQKVFVLVIFYADIDDSVLCSSAWYGNRFAYP